MTDDPQKPPKPAKHSQQPQGFPPNVYDDIFEEDQSVSNESDGYLTPDEFTTGNKDETPTEISVPRKI